MDENTKTFWWRFWGRPLRFFLWLTAASLLAAVGSSLILDRVYRGPNWTDEISFECYLGLCGSVCCIGLWTDFLGHPEDAAVDDVGVAAMVFLRSSLRDASGTFLCRGGLARQARCGNNAKST